MADLDPLTPQQRLANSRRALVEEWHGHEDTKHEAVDPVALSANQPFEGEAPQLPQRPQRPRSFDAALWAQVGRQVLSRWWRRHPANAAGQLARPLIERYAREEPAKLLAAAAGTGALLVLVRPWRLLSLTAVIAALLKTSDVADLVTTLMHKPPPPRKDPP
jgi:hypothetical protein